MSEPEPPRESADGPPPAAPAATPAPPAPRPRTRARRLAAVGLGVLGALLALEIGLRVLGVAPPPVTKRWLMNDDDPAVRYDCYATNPGGTFGELPDTTRGRWRVLKMLDPPVPVPLEDLAATPWCVEYRKESTGVRGPAIRPLPAAGVLRIAGIGDSFAQGDGVPHEHTVFSQLAALLGPGYEVLNLGQSGADTDLNLRTLEWTVRQYRPTRALVVFTPNDVLLSGDLGEEQRRVFDLVNLREEHLEPQGRPWYLRVSRTLALISSWRARRRIAAGTIEGYLAAYDPARNPENLARFDEQLRRMASQPGCRTALVLYPFLIDLDDYPLAPIHTYVAERARAAGLPVLDLAPAFAGEDASDLHVHPTDHHPNRRGHAIAAEAIVTWLRAELPDFLRRP